MLSTLPNRKLGQICSTGAADVDFLAWLRGTVSQAARVAEEYQTLTQIVQDVRADIESQFQLTCVMVSHSKEGATLTVM